ncbi:MAG: hypothetical protein ACNS60_08185 [Candidatus Cyclobacteriaceae bacterium M2_1C_046]
MLKQIKEKLEQISMRAKERELAMISQFGNPIAEQAGWSPIKGGGSNFKSQVLVWNELNNQLKVAKSVGGKLFFGLFALIGSGILLFAAGEASGVITTGNINESGELLPVLIFGSIFFLVGTIPLFRNKYLAFDKAQGFCWEGNNSPRNVIRAEETAKLIRLERIKGLQIIKERISSSKSSYYSYELNLILDDNSRVNVMDHGSQSSIRSDAKKLGDYLNVPIFDGSDF